MALVSTLALAGCDSLLEVELPGNLPSEGFLTPENAPMIVNSAQSQFECFFANYVGARAVWTDEAVSGSQRAGRQYWMTRQRLPISGAGTGPCESTSIGNAWTSVSNHYRALGLGRDASEALEEWSDGEVPDRMELLAKARAYTAYTIMLFGESYCAGAVLEPDASLSRPWEVMEAAEGWWDRTLQAAETASAGALRNLALVGRARVRLWRGNLSGAAQDAEQVPSGFRYDATYEEHPERENHVATEFGRDIANSVYPGLTGLDTMVAGTPDPRVRVVDREKAAMDGRTPLWTPAKYMENSDPIRMASWEEAQLIIAEARLGQEAVDRINALRELHGLPAYEPETGSDDEILDQVLEERRRELFVEGHRLNDMLRHFDRPSIRSAWPEGETHDGDPYYDRYCWWFPQGEIDGNPNVSSDDIPRSMTPDVMRP